MLLNNAYVMNIKSVKIKERDCEQSKQQERFL